MSEQNLKNWNDNRITKKGYYADKRHYDGSKRKSSLASSQASQKEPGLGGAYWALFWFGTILWIALAWIVLPFWWLGMWILATMMRK